MIRWLVLGLVLWTSSSLAGTRVEAEGHGATLDLAKKDAFRNAIEFAVGQVIVSDIEANGDKLTKEFLGGYSAGYIEDYEIRQTHYVGGEVVVILTASVATSKIAQRMLASSDRKTVINGQKLQDQLDSMLDQRSRGDLIVSNVLGSYPQNAYIINNGNNELAVGNRRQVYIDVPYEIQWSRYWLEALVETVDLVAVDSKQCSKLPGSVENLDRVSFTVSLTKFLQERGCGPESDMTIVYKKPQAWMLTKHNYYFPDLSTLDNINNEIRTPMGRQHFGLVADLKDAGGNVLDSSCTKISTEPFIEYTIPQNEVVSWSKKTKLLRPRINGQASIAGTLRINAKNINLADVAKVEMHLEKTCN